MSQWHSKTTKEVLDQLNVTAQEGLTDSEAKKDWTSTDQMS